MSVHKNKSTKLNGTVTSFVPFVFLFCKGWVNGIRDRSGCDLLLRAFSEEFTKEDNVELILKLNSAYNPPGWDINEEIKKLNLDLSDKPPIKIITENIPFAQLRSLYIQADVSVIPTKGEGFGLTLLESLACGVPVVTTDFGGQTDFVTEENGWLLPTKLIPSTDHNPLYEECEWAICEVSDIRKILRHLYEHPEEIKAKIPKAIETAKRFTWDNSAKQAMSALEKLK